MNERKERSESSEGGKRCYGCLTQYRQPGKPGMWDSKSSQQHSWVFSPLRNTPVSLGEWFLTFRGNTASSSSWVRQLTKRVYDPCRWRHCVPYECQKAFTQLYSTASEQTWNPQLIPQAWCKNNTRGEDKQWDDGNDKKDGQKWGVGGRGDI